MLKKGFHGFCMALAVLIPLILTDERPAFRQMRKGLPFGLIGILLVVGITWLNS